jgi:Spy/CpxP family protein refolding chaperone
MASSRWLKILVLAALVAVGSLNAASAQQRGRGGFGGRMGGGGDGLMILALPPVQKELNLTDAQKTAVREVTDEMQSSFAGLRDLSQEERREKMQEMQAKSKELRAKVDATLEPAQKDRLKQLVLQRRGAFGALQDADVATALKLTDEQKKKVETLAEESRPGRGQGGGGGAGGDREAMRERFQALQKERNEKALGILTAEQKAEFEKMQGAKFEFPAGRGLPGA